MRGLWVPTVSNVYRGLSANRTTCSETDRPDVVLMSGVECTRASRGARVACLIALQWRFFRSNDSKIVWTNWNGLFFEFSAVRVVEESRCNERSPHSSYHEPKFPSPYIQIFQPEPLGVNTRRLSQRCLCSSWSSVCPPKQRSDFWDFVLMGSRFSVLLPSRSSSPEYFRYSCQARGCSLTIRLKPMSDTMLMNKCEPVYRGILYMGSTSKGSFSTQGTSIGEIERLALINGQVGQQSKRAWICRVSSEILVVECGVSVMPPHILSALEFE